MSRLLYRPDEDIQSTSWWGDNGLSVGFFSRSFSWLGESWASMMLSEKAFLGVSVDVYLSSSWEQSVE